MISSISEEFGGDSMKKISLLFLTMLLGILVGCTDSSDPDDGTMYTVSFDTSIDVISGIEDIRVPSGKTVDAPEISTDVTYEEYDLEFEGWYLDGVLFDFSSAITDDTHLEARWKTITPLTTQLADLLDLVAVGYRRYFIAKITDPIDVTFDAYPFPMATKYGIEDPVYLKGSTNNGYVWIHGGEIEPNISLYLDYFPRPVETGHYHLIIQHESWEEQYGRDQKGIYGHSLIVLPTYDPTKGLHEQNEETMAILQPYIDAIDAYHEQVE